MNREALRYNISTVQVGVMNALLANLPAHPIFLNGARGHKIIKELENFTLIYSPIRFMNWHLTGILARFSWVVFWELRERGF